MVIGLGRFGSRLALELMNLGHDVLGVDASSVLVQRYGPSLTKAIEADTTRPEVLAQLDAASFNHVVVGIGDVEASILTVAELVTIGVRDVWAKAVTQPHRRILEKVGATHVVQPEDEMGRRIAHQVTGKVVDFIELDEGFALVEALVPEKLWGMTLYEAQVRANYGVTVVCIKPKGQTFTYAQPDTVLEQDAMLLVAGDTDSVEAFGREAP